MYGGNSVPTGADRPAGRTRLVMLYRKPLLWLERTLLERTLPERTSLERTSPEQLPNKQRHNQQLSAPLGS